MSILMLYLSLVVDLDSQAGYKPSPPKTGRFRPPRHLGPPLLSGLLRLLGHWLDQLHLSASNGDRSGVTRGCEVFRTRRLAFYWVLLRALSTLP